MRYLDEITFVKKGKAVYDPDSSSKPTPEAIETAVRANVTDLGLERSMALFGDIKQGRKTIRLRPHIPVLPWDYLKYKGKTYQLVKDIEPQDRNSLIVEEFNHG